MRSLLVALGLVLIAGTAACGPTIYTTASTPRSVEVAYDPFFHSPDEAAQIAEAHCLAQENRHARQSDKRTQVFRVVTFDCVE